MTPSISIARNENGFVLVAALLTLLLLVIIGVSATTTSTFEVQIAGNEKVYNMAFYQANGGVDLGAEILEQNISCRTGFRNLNGDNTVGDSVYQKYRPLVVISDFQYHTRTSLVYKPLSADEQALLVAAGATVEAPQIPDMFLPGTVDPADPDATMPRTLVSFAGQNEWNPGGSIQMAAGYEGQGKGSSGGGVTMVYDVTSRHIGLGNSESTVHQQWRHVVGQEGPCNY